MKSFPTSFSATIDELTDLDEFIGQVGALVQVKVSELATSHRVRRSQPIRSIEDMKVTNITLKNYTSQMRKLMSMNNRSTVVRALIRIAANDEAMRTRVVAELEKISKGQNAKNGVSSLVA